MKIDFDILAVDDEKIVIDALKKICEFENLTVDTASDGTVALDKISNNNYGLILCDIMMPEMDGFQFLGELKNKKKNTPVIITSGYSTSENAVKAMHEGAIDFLPKPFTFEELSSTLMRGMNFSRLNKSTNYNLQSSGFMHSLYVACPPQYYRLGYISWVKLNTDGIAMTGIVNLFFELTESVSRIRLQPKGANVVLGQNFLTVIDSKDREHSVLSPVSGKIVEINDSLTENINLMEKDPYFKGWVYKIIPSDTEHDIAQLIPCSSDRV
jgi:CheY-like chemotaxis protein